MYGKKAVAINCNATYYKLLTDTCRRCARPLSIGLTGPGAAACQKVSSVTLEGDTLTIVPPLVVTLSITWCGGHIA